jgi:hypothetical protein
MIGRAVSGGQGGVVSSLYPALLLLAAPVVAGCSHPTAAPAGQWGRLANPGFEGQRIKTTLFFAGQARDGSAPYACQPPPNVSLYTVHPIDPRDLNWSVDRANRDGALAAMTGAGLNVVTMSSWGERSLPCSTGWTVSAPMQTAPAAHDELFAAAEGKPLLLMPLLESRDDWAFRDEFPRDKAGRTAPGTVTQINDLIERYLKNPRQPEWAGRWARVYDRRGEPRHAVVLIHAASDRLAPDEDEAFASGLAQVAEEVFRATQVKVGFFLDALPPNMNAPGRFKPTPEGTAPRLRETDAVLGIQCFLPEVWLGQRPQPERLAWKRGFAAAWYGSGVPLLMDVSPGYDNRLVFPEHRLVYGFDDAWRSALTDMVRDFGKNGMVFNCWNGYTEGMAAVPTREHGDTFSRWLQSLE